MNTAELQETKLIRQRASIKWLLSKAFNNRVPGNLLEPFYFDHEGHERLKPQIIVELANASLYCQVLSNLYSDPNYQSLNHWSILQVLTRKGMPIIDSSDIPITESVLIQTNPIKLLAHMHVIESFMLLYAKEISLSGRVNEVISRISGSIFQPAPGHGTADYLLSWVSCACLTYNNIIQNDYDGKGGGDFQNNKIAPLNGFDEIFNGESLALLVSYYCPNALPWTTIRINHLPTVESCLYNISLVKDFSEKYLPYNVFHMTSEDVALKKCSKLNLVVLLADLFNLFEIHPAKCVSYVGMESRVTNFNISSEATRKHNATLENLLTEPNWQRDDQNEGFIVHKSRGVPTLSTISTQKQSKQDDWIPTDHDAAGIPSAYEKERRPSFAGRRSRRNSSSEESQLTIENFGGSQDQLNLIDRFERTRERTVERKLSITSLDTAVPVRSSLADARGTFKLGYDNDSGSEIQHNDQNSTNQKDKGCRNENLIALNKSSSVSRLVQSPKRTPPESKDLGTPKSTNPGSVSADTNLSTDGKAPLLDAHEMHDEDLQSWDNASKLSTICKKLEERKRRIEQDKLKIQLAILRYQEKEDADGMKWETQSNASRRGNDLDTIDLEKYQQSIAIMNMNLQEIQQDIHRLVSQHNQIQAQHYQAQQLNSMLNQQQNFGSQQHLTDLNNQRYVQHNFGSSPHLMQTPSSAYSSRPPSRDTVHQMPQIQHFPTQYTNDQGQYKHTYNQISMSPFSESGINISLIKHAYSEPQYDVNNQYCARSDSFDEYGSSNNFQMPEKDYSQHFLQRRTWGHSPSTTYDCSQQHQQHQQQQAHNPYVNVNAWPSEIRTDNWGNKLISNYSAPSTFILSQNGGQPELHSTFQMNNQHQRNYKAVHRQQSLTNLHDNRASNCIGTMNNMPVGLGMNTLQQEDMMAPQSICFIGDEDNVEDLEQNILESLSSTRIYDFVQDDQIDKSSGINRNTTETTMAPQIAAIASSNLGYQKQSPSRFPLDNTSFQVKAENSGEGFYISFDDQPKRPKPPLRTKRSPKKDSCAKENSSISKTIRNNGSLSKEYKEQGSPTAMNAKMKLPSQLKAADGTDITDNMTPLEISTATYNKYSDMHMPPLLLHKLKNEPETNDLVKRTVHSLNENSPQSKSENTTPRKTKPMIIEPNPSELETISTEEMERRKEKILLLSLQRRQQQEEAKAQKEILAAQSREKERQKEEDRARKKEIQSARRSAILEQYRLKKAAEEAEREGKSIDRNEHKHNSQPMIAARTRHQRNARPRPKTIHVDDVSVDISEGSSISSRGKKGSISNLTGYGNSISNTLKRDSYGGSQDSLSIKESPDECHSASLTPFGRKGSCKTSREPNVERGKTLSCSSVVKEGILRFRSRKCNSLINLCDTDSGLGRATPPRRAPSPGMAGSGPKLYKQPASKSNRSILLNAVEYCVFPGAVNREAKQKVLEKIARSEAKHFLILFRDSGCQFRALYSYTPDTEQVIKLYGTGPSHVNEQMFDKFFKYNSGGKCFAQVHTKHLTVTIDAFTIHNSLWQGKKLQLPNKKDMALVI